MTIADAKPRPRVYTPDGCAEIARLIKEGLHREKLSYAQVQLWIERRVDVPDHLSVPQGASLGMLIAGKTRTLKVETLRILHCAGLFGDRPLEVIEAIACGMSVEEAERVPGATLGEEFWEQLPAKVKSAPRNVKIATAIAILESLESEKGDAENGTAENSIAESPPQPRSPSEPMFFLSPQDSQQRLAVLFQHWHPNQTPVAIAQYYADTLGVNLITVGRIEQLLAGETLLDEIEYGCLSSSKLDLQQENGDPLTPEELRWFCQATWKNVTTNPSASSKAIDHQDTADLPHNS
ncbi:MAG: hypothetical protein AAF889_14985 [Cyanobacteria bacterium P01_D01_bin.73]